MFGLLPKHCLNARSAAVAHCPLRFSLPLSSSLFKLCTFFFYTSEEEQKQMIFSEKHVYDGWLGDILYRPWLGTGTKSPKIHKFCFCCRCRCCVVTLKLPGIDDTFVSIDTHFLYGFLFLIWTVMRSIKWIVYGK